MSAKPNASLVLEESKDILVVWSANPGFTLGDMTETKFKATSDGLDATLTQIKKLEGDLQALANQRDDQATALREWNTRLRSGIRGAFGPDSTEYEQAGGTRKSERKHPSRKPNDGQQKAA